MKLHYYPETDSLYIEFSEEPGVETREVTNGVNVDIDARDRGRPTVPHRRPAWSSPAAKHAPRASPACPGRARSSRAG